MENFASGFSSLSLGIHKFCLEFQCSCEPQTQNERENQEKENVLVAKAVGQALGDGCSGPSFAKNFLYDIGKIS